MQLVALLEGLDVRLVAGEPAGVEVTSVVHDSRAVAPGALFCCVVGTAVDGHDLAARAVAAGAVAVLCQRPLPVAVPQVVVDDVRRSMGAFAAALHGHPSRHLDVVGITGTNGKTTTAHLLAAVLEAAGRPTGVIGNLTAVPGGPPNTPEGPEVRARLAAFRRQGATAVAVEVSSHALVQGRVSGTEFALAVFTNLTPDHLDHHGTMEAYFAAKARLFERDLARAAVVNVGDPHGKLLLDAAVIPTAGFTREDASDVAADLSGTSFTWRGQRMHIALPGAFNVANAVAAATAAAALGVDAATIGRGLATAPQIPGRFEVVARGGPVHVVVDYAHTPDGLRQLLSAVRTLVGTGRVHVVFGCGGDRDRTKRPAMGAIAAELADHVVVTSDNPRASEPPERIVDEVAAGADEVPGRPPVARVVDRRTAIAVALRGARPGDVVVVAGKGHEATQITGDREVPFDDRVVAAELLAELGSAPAGPPTREDGQPWYALLVAGTVAFLTSIIGTPFLLSWLRAHGIGQPIREDGPKGHVTKAGTPTMGGIAIVAGTLLGYALAHLRDQTIFTRGGILVVLAIAGAGFVGGVDDWIKVRNARNLGLNKRAKIGGLLVVAVGFAILAERWANVPTTLSFTRHDSIGIELPPFAFVIWAVLLFLGTSNGVNLTDGLDGLAAGSSIFSWAAYTVIAFWAFRHPDVYQIPQALDLALIGAAMVGALAGFLWWNAPPARIFMGDTGSLAIGAGLAAVALMTSTHLLLPIIGGIFVIETLSVITQVASFRLFGRRLYRMAPIHHHFELGGWPETTVIVRFWILAGLSTALAIGIYYADYLSIPGAID